MVGDLNMNGMEEGENDQIMKTFAALAPLLEGQVQLSPDPRLPKRRKDGPKSAEQDGTKMLQQQVQMQTALKTMALMLLRHERHWNELQRSDCFVLYFQQDPTGALPGLLSEAKKWQEARQQSPSMLTAPLRQHLVQWLLKDLMNRLNQVATSAPDSDLHQTCLKRKILLEDHSWPYLRWDPSQKMLVVDKKKSIQMPKMLEHVTELMEDFTDPNLVIRFHSLASNQDQKILPWRLQLNLRMDRAYELLRELCHSSIWLLAGLSLKAHTPHQSALAKSLQTLLNPQKGKGKGRTW